MKNRPNTEPQKVRYIAVGRIIKPHGVRGEVSAVLLTDFPERFETTEWLYLGDEYEADPYELESFRWHKSNILLKFVEVTDRNYAEALRGLYVQVPVEEAVPLPEGEFYIYQLIGLQVETTEGESLGIIEQVLETGANDVYVVKHGDREILLPAIPDVVKKVDLQAQLVTVQMMDGLR